MCLFAVKDRSREGAYRGTVEAWAPRFRAAGAALHHATSSFNFKFFGRFQLALQAPTAYVWVVDDDVVPGLRFLEVPPGRFSLPFFRPESSLTFGRKGAQ